MRLRVGLVVPLATLVWGMTAPAGAQGGPDCGAWLADGYWGVASGADVRRCLRGGGADVDARDRHGGTALHLAARHGSVEAVRALLDAGADVNTRTKDGETPLHSAVMLGSTETVRTLLDAGADANARTSEGVTALHLAAALGAAGRVRILLDAGADKEARATRRRLPFHFAETGRRMVDEVDGARSGRKGRNRGRRDSAGVCKEAAEKYFGLLDSPFPDPREACRMLATVSRFPGLIQFRWDLSGRPFWDLLRALGGERRVMDGLRESYREARDLLQVSDVR